MMVIKFNEKQLALLKKLGLNYNFTQELTDDECIELEEKVSDYLVLHCLDENYEPTEDGRICESILDLLVE